MTKLLETAGRSFLRAFAASLIVLGPGILAAPDLHKGLALGIAALVASLAAGLKVIQVYVPSLTFAGLVPAPYGEWVDSFARAFLAAFVTAIIGILSMPTLSGWRSLVLAAVIGAITAGIRALEGLLTKGDAPNPAVGLKEAA